MARFFVAALVFAWFAFATAAAAADVQVSGSEPRTAITVTIEGAGVHAVLDNLRARYGFEVSGMENVTGGEPLSTTLSGSLQNVLERLLRNWNHMIVRSTDNECGIAKVMVLNSNYGTTPPRTPAVEHAIGNSGIEPGA